MDGGRCERAGRIKAPLLLAVGTSVHSQKECHMTHLTAPFEDATTAVHRSFLSLSETPTQASLVPFKRALTGVLAETYRLAQKDGFHQTGVVALPMARAAVRWLLMDAHQMLDATEADGYHRSFTEIFGALTVLVQTSAKSDAALQQEG
jgi:hypothetical protein